MYPLPCLFVCSPPRARRQGQPHRQTSRRDNQHGDRVTFSTRHQARCHDGLRGPHATSGHSATARGARAPHGHGHRTLHGAQTSTPSHSEAGSSQPTRSSSARRPSNAQAHSTSQQNPSPHSHRRPWERASKRGRTRQPARTRSTGASRSWRRAGRTDRAASTPSPWMTGRCLYRGDRGHAGELRRIARQVGRVLPGPRRRLPEEARHGIAA